MKKSYFFATNPSYPINSSVKLEEKSNNGYVFLNLYNSDNDDYQDDTKLGGPANHYIRELLRIKALIDENNLTGEDRVKAEKEAEIAEKLSKSFFS